MLIITRRAGESLLLGNDIEVAILDTGSQVRIDIIAPREIEVLRSELIREGDFEKVLQASRINSA